jgi:hypothetical protein
MHAHVGMMLALHGAKPSPEFDSSKEKHWGRRKLKRDEQSRRALFGRLRRVWCFIAPQGDRPIAIEASKRAGLVAAGRHHQDQFVPALRARRNGDHISGHSGA